jgi:hypothetical protein
MKKYKIDRPKSEKVEKTLHIGSEIRRILEGRGITPEFLASQINSSRRNVYDILTRQEISTGQLQQISRALNYDFFGLYSGTSDDPKQTYTKRRKVVISVELDGLQTTLDEYMQLLNQVNKTLA